VEDANARGFGSFTSQPANQQNVSGRGLWHDGFWNVLFTRDLTSEEPQDVRFSGNRPVPVAFAVWNGEQGDRNGRKLVSNWYQLVFESKDLAVKR
jgi:DMSO reductase family type II enzyme heme b subunit